MYEEPIQYPTATVSRLLVEESSSVELVAVEEAAVSREPDTAEACESVRSGLVLEGIVPASAGQVLG